MKRRTPPVTDWPTPLALIRARRVLRGAPTIHHRAEVDETLRAVRALNDAGASLPRAIAPLVRSVLDLLDDLERNPR